MTNCSLAGKSCVVTGGANGIGWALTGALAEAGARVHACDISEEHLTSARRDLANYSWGHRVRFATCDVAEERAVSAWVNEIVADQGHIDLLINNAAFIRWGSLEELSVEDQRRIMRVGYEGMVHTISRALPHMGGTRCAHIVNIGSAAGRTFVTGPSAAYLAMKAATEGYTRMLQLELGQSAIHATLVRPGVVAGTDFYRRHVPSSRLPRMADLMPATTPPAVAAAILRAVQRHRSFVDIPGSLRFMHAVFTCAPRLFQRLVVQGSCKKDFGAVQWSPTDRSLR